MRFGRRLTLVSKENSQAPGVTVVVPAEQVIIEADATE